MKKFLIVSSLTFLAGCLFGGGGNAGENNGSSNNGSTNNGQNNGTANNGTNGCDCLEPGENETVFCENQECIYECEIGFLDCDGVPGCEFAETPESCGCETSCTFDDPATANATGAFCEISEIGERCVSECIEDTFDQNGSVYDGCEVTCVPTAGLDVPGDGIDNDCDLVDGVLEDMYFVDFDAPEDGNGTVSAPANRFELVDEVMSTKKTVVIRGDGVFPFMTGVDELSFYGGYDDNWMASTVPSRIENATDAAPALGMIDSTASFENFTFATKDVLTNPPRILRVVDVATSTLTFSNCVFEAGDIIGIPMPGAPGTSGNVGTNGVQAVGTNGAGAPVASNGGAGGNVTRFPNFQNGSAGMMGQEVAGQSGGAGGEGGANVPLNGTPGNAENGDNGTDGLPGQKFENEAQFLQWMGNQLVPYRLLLAADQGNGTRGAGGGGGGGGGTKENFFNDGRGGSSGGGGGRGGRRGEPGITGTSTIGVIMRGGANFTVNNVTIERGQAGNGSAGGSGGCGGPGGVGGQISTVNNVDAGLAGRGGDGGTGGNGSHGTAGNGGLSIGVVLINNQSNVSDFMQSGGEGGRQGSRHGGVVCADTGTIIEEALDAIDGDVIEALTVPNN